VVNDKELIPIAVKGIKRNAGLLHLQSLLSELKILSQLPSHENIVNIVAASTENLRQSIFSN
jgi:hypothetical protein